MKIPGPFPVASEQFVREPHARSSWLLDQVKARLNCRSKVRVVLARARRDSHQTQSECGEKVFSGLEGLGALISHRGICPELEQLYVRPFQLQYIFRTPTTPMRIICLSRDM
jgi:hypothetical protein